MTETPDRLHLGGDAYAHPTLATHLADITALTTYPGNPRRGDQDAITASIRDHGLYRPLVVQSSTGHILVGNHTYRALVDLGATQAPITHVDVTDDEAAAIVIRDNRTSDLGGYDDRDLYDLLTRATTDTPYTPDALGYPAADLATLQRMVEALDVFTHGPGDMLDEFRTIAGIDGGTDYLPEYARKVTVFLRDDAAIEDFKQRLGLTEPPGKDLNWPLGWLPNDRRKRPNGEPASA